MQTGKRIYTTPRIDLIFVLLAVTGAVLIFLEPRDHVATLASPPWLQLLVGLTVTTVITGGVVWAGKFDRRCAEDYAFQLAANSALAAIPVTIFIHSFWDMEAINRLGLAKPTSGDMVGVMIFSWALAYATYRIKGLNA